jgi:hypothetical protein
MYPLSFPFLDKVDLLFNLPNPSGRTMALGSTQSVTEMSTRNHPGGKGRTARRAENLAAICESIVWTKCGSLDLSQSYRSSMACYTDSFTFYLFYPCVCDFSDEVRYLDFWGLKMVWLIYVLVIVCFP